MNSWEELKRSIDESRARRREEAARQATEGGALAPSPSHQQPRREPVQLPLWPEPVRAVPNGFLRSALFAVGGASKGRKREHLKSVQLAAVEGMSVRYTGERLDQNDLDVWETVLHAVRQQAMGDTCHVTAYSLLKLMGLTDTGKNRQLLSERIERLASAVVKIQCGRYSYVGALISGAVHDEQTREWVIRMNPDVRPLFAPDQFTQVQWAVRQELGKNQLAKWLHGYYSTHAKPYPMRVEKLLHLAGSTNKSSRSSNQKARDALAAIAAASDKHGEEFAFEVQDGMVYVDRRPSRSQRRHLRRKGAA